MSGYLPDTDTSIELMRGRNPAVLERLASTASNQVALSVVTVAELTFGALRSQNSSRNLEICRRFSESFEVLPLTMAAAASSGELRSTLETAGLRIGPYDVLIAGIALAASARNVVVKIREFHLEPIYCVTPLRRGRLAG